MYFNIIIGIILQILMRIMNYLIMISYNILEKFKNV